MADPSPFTWEWLLTVPVLGAAATAIWSGRRATAAVQRDLDGFKERVATERASNGYVAEVERRLTEHLTRIEGKLDRVIETDHRKR